VFGPQSAVLLLLLLLGFAGLAYVLARPGILALRVGAGTMAFALSAVFGMACVNRFYDYYQTWGDLFDDLSGQQPGLVKIPPGAGLHLKATGDAATAGQMLSQSFAGAKSGITRDGLVYLPPEYFQPKYAGVRFPVLELLHGAPGSPGQWEVNMHTTEIFRDLTLKKKVKPAILVMPLINNSNAGSPGSQCLDAHGELDDTYLSQDIPALVSAQYRAQPPGPHWGVAGLSEGGFCAANLALRHPDVFAVAGVMSGYFSPVPVRGVLPFAGNSTLQLANDPVWLATNVKLGQKLPDFWLMAGGSDRGDMTNATDFRAVLAHNSSPVFVQIPRVRHTFGAWRLAYPKLLTWATTKLFAGITTDSGAPVTGAAQPLPSATAPYRR